MGRFASVERDGPPAVITSRERDDCGKLPDDRAGVDALRLHAGGVRNGRADMRAICERHDFFRRVTSQTMDSLRSISAPRSLRLRSLEEGVGLGGLKV
jgi:hypothetical protein